jgi:hypothetical protein
MKKFFLVAIVVAMAIVPSAFAAEGCGANEPTVINFAVGQTLLYLTIEQESGETKVSSLETGKVETVRQLCRTGNDFPVSVLAFCPAGVEVLEDAFGRPFLAPEHGCCTSFVFSEELVERFRVKAEERGMKFIPLR